LGDELAPSGRAGEACLEVGPGQGQMLANLKRIGWHSVGLDIDPAAAAIAERMSGCEVKVGSLLTCDLEPCSFDMVYMSHVVEHLPDLLESLTRCLLLLKPLGRLVLVYPNRDGLTAKYYERYSCVWDPPRHLVLPPKEAMVRLLSNVGFEQVAACTTARRAAAYRAIARHYRTSSTPMAGKDYPPLMSDRLFWMWEALLVAFRASVGEEILFTA
jgi:SAM-dependent methyltransferase